MRRNNIRPLLSSSGTHQGHPRRLEDLGIESALALRLLKRYGQARIDEVLTFSGKAQNPAGFVLKALAERWTFKPRRDVRAPASTWQERWARYVGKYDGIVRW